MNIAMRTLLVGALLASACSSPVYVEDLKKPALIWDQMRGLCGRVLGVDADGTVWGERGGCEDGRPALTSRGQSEPTKLDALRKAFDVLPVPPTSGGDCAGMRDRFSRWTAAANLEWSTCTSREAYNDLTGLMEPYASVAAKFIALP